MSSVSYVTNLLGPGLASATMGTKLWLPFALGICLLLLAVPTISLLPGGTTTIPHTPGKSKHASSRNSRTDNGEQQPFLPSSPLLKAAQSASPSTVQNIFSLTKAHIHTLGTTFLSSPNSSPNPSSSPHHHHHHHAEKIQLKNLPLLLASFLLTALASSDTRLLPQYVSKRYAWRLVDVGYLLSCKAVVNFVLLVFVVPRVLRRSSSRRRRQQRRGDGGHGEYENIQDDDDNNDDDRDAYAQDDCDSSPMTPTSTTTSRAAIKAETRANILHARICLCVSLAGAVLIASAGSVALLFPALGIYALGSALPVFTLSLLKSPFIVPVPVPGPASMTPASEHLAPSSSASNTTIISSDTREIAQVQDSNDTPDDQGDTAKAATAETQLFALVMMTKTLGALLGAPLMATLWVRGIYLGGAGLGIPYLVSGACYAAAISVFVFIEV